MSYADPVTLSVKRAANRRTRRAVNVSLDAGLVEDAQALGVNVSRACQAGLEERVREARRERWREENGEAIESSNAYVEANGLPLARFRQF